MKYAAESFNQDFGYNVKFSFRGLAPIDAASRMIQDGGSARVADIAEIEHDLLGRLVVAGGAMENLVSAARIKSTFLPNATSAAEYAGASYGFPVSYATLALFYNKELLPNAPKTFEEIITLPCMGLTNSVKTALMLKIWALIHRLHCKEWKQ